MRNRTIMTAVVVPGFVLLIAVASAAVGFSEASKQLSPDNPSTRGAALHSHTVLNRSGLSVFSSSINVSEVYTSYLPQINKIPDPWYFDDFSDPDSGWPVDDTPEIRWNYFEGEYEILMRSSNFWAGATAPIEGLADYTVEADMRRQTGSTSDYGLIFDFLDWDNFYLFALDPGSQWYAMIKVEDGSTDVIVPLTSSGYINMDYNTNHLKVKRLDNQINLYVNGEHLATATDSTFLGDLGVGLYAESDADAPAVVRYDNFGIWLLGSEIIWSEERRTHPSESSTGSGGALLAD